MRYVRVVLDTNILISALITKGSPPDRLYQAWLRGVIKLVTSKAQIRELADVLARPRLQRFLDPDEAKTIVENIDTRAVILDQLPDVVASPDPSDNQILATAVAGTVDLIITGDRKGMLDLQSIEGIPIMTARDALELVTRSPDNMTWEKGETETPA